MAVIYIRGKQDPIQLSNEDAYKIKKALDDNQARNTTISLKDKSWRLAEIKGVEIEYSPKDDKSHEKRMEEFKTDRLAFLKLPLEERVRKNLSHFELFYWTMRNDLPTNDEKQQATERITKFFTDNPKWSVPSCKIYKGLVKELTAVKTQWHEAGFRCLLETERGEFFRAGNYKI